MRTRDSLRPWLVVAVAVAALPVLAAGCGGSSPSSAGQTQQTTTHDMTTTDQMTTTGSSGTSFASAKNCRDFAGLAAKIAGAVSAGSGNPATAVQTESRELQALADAAPADIKGDFQTFATAFSSYLHAIEKAGYEPGQRLTAPSAAQLAAFGNAAKVLSSPKLTKAERHLAAWVQANCT